jgi:hypothetical protein
MCNIENNLWFRKNGSKNSSSNLVHFYPQLVITRVLFLSRIGPVAQNLFTYLKIVFVFGTCSTENFRLNLRHILQDRHATYTPYRIKPSCDSIPAAINVRLHEYRRNNLCERSGQAIRRVREIPRYKVANRMRPRTWNYGNYGTSTVHITTSRHWTVYCWIVYTAKRLVTENEFLQSLTFDSSSILIDKYVVSSRTSTAINLCLFFLPCGHRLYYDMP